VKVPLHPDAWTPSQEQTEVESFAVLEPIADGFRSYQKNRLQCCRRGAAARQGAALDANCARDDGADRWSACAERQRRTKQARCPHQETGDTDQRLFKNLLDMGTQWTATSEAKEVYEGRDRNSGELKWTVRAPILCSAPTHSCARLAEVYAKLGCTDQFVCAFVAAWDKVMNLDRFDLK